MNVPRAISCVALVVLAACSDAAPPARADESRVELVQSVPAGAQLGLPALAATRDVWLDMVKGAKASIDLAQFYASSEPGGMLEAVLDELARAAARKVKIRFLVSAAMADTYPADIERVRKLPAEVRILDLKPVTGGILHAKYWIVDGREAFLGSPNFDWRALEHIHELGVRFDVPACVAGLGRIYEADWRRAGGEPVEAASEAPSARSADCELVASPPKLGVPGVGSSIDALVALIAGAKTEVQLQALSYSPGKKGKEWTVLADAMRAAGARGVAVSLVVSHWNAGHDAGLAALQALDRLPGVSVHVVTVPAADKAIPFARVVHAKYCVVDRARLWIGTSNFSEDYFAQSRNVELVIARAPLAAAAAAAHDALAKGPHAVRAGAATVTERGKDRR